MSKIYKGSIGLVGNTPLVEVVNIEKEENLEATVLVKLEYFNPAGSVKDRIAKAMIEEAEAAGKLKNAKLLAFVTQPAEADTTIKCPCVKLGARPSVEDIRALAPSADVDAYLCGPGDFMSGMRAALEAAGVPARQIHAEVFGTGSEA